jgi:hypothetical protein
MYSGEDRLIQWSPSRKDKVPPGTKRSDVSGRLIYVRLQKKGKWIDLWLFTTLDAPNYPLDLLVRWYGQRWQAELHFRSTTFRPPAGPLQAYYWPTSSQLVGNHSDVDPIHIGVVA